MAWLLCVAVMASFGALSILWALFGWMTPGSRGGIMVCYGTPGFAQSGFVRRYLFLRDLGLLGSPLLVVDQGLAEPERRWLEKRLYGIEICSPEELFGRLELERDQIAGTGNGNHSGRDRRRGISEL